MKLVVNEKLIKSRRTIALVLTLGTLLILILSLWASFTNTPKFRNLSYVGLIVGLVTSQVSMYFTNRYSRDPRHDQVLAVLFDKLPREYSFWVFASPLPLLLLSPCGFWIPMPVTATGEISWRDGKWRQKGGNFLMKLFGQESIGNPTRDAAIAEQTLRKWMDAQGIAPDEQPPIKPVLVALDQRTIIADVENAPVPFIAPADLRQYIRRIDNTSCESPLDDATLNKFNELLLAYNKK